MAAVKHLRAQAPVSPGTKAAHKIVITSTDRRRLGTWLEKAHSLGLADRHTRYDLQEELERANWIDERDVTDDVVTMNSTVRLRNLASGEVFDCTLVYPNEVHPRGACVSILDPEGTAILGCQVGDTVEWTAEDGPVTARIEEVVYQPERGHGCR